MATASRRNRVDPEPLVHQHATGYGASLADASDGGLTFAQKRG